MDLMERTKVWLFTTATAVILLIGGIVVVAILLAGGGKDGVVSHGRRIDATRMLLVAREAGRPSAPGGALHAVLVSGTIPAAPTMATVRSDENCTPDPMGYSHCLNMLLFDGGEKMTVVHTHRMSEVPCLAPGERIEVRAA
jgi:hypothetical protein